jgi:hypothetical protein
MTLTSLNLFAACLALAGPARTESSGPGERGLPPGALLRLGMVPSGGRAAKYPDYPARVEFVAFTPDGKRLITANFDDLIRHWDLAAGKELARWRGRQSVVWAAALSPDGRTVVMGSGFEGQLSLWQPARNKELPHFAGRHPAVKALAFSPDGSILASGSSRYENGLVSVWAWPTGKKLHQFSLKLGDVAALAFSPDSTTLACAASGGVRLWDVKTGRELRTLAARAACALAFSPDGSRLATPHGAPLDGESGLITLWEVATGKAVRRLIPLVTDGRYGWTAAVAFSADGRTLASVGGDRCLRVWDVAAGKERCVFRGHSEPVLSVAFSPDGRKLVTGGGDTAIVVWDTWGLSMPSAVELARGGLPALWRALGREEGEPAVVGPPRRKRPKKDSPPVLREDLRQAHHAVGLLVAAPEKMVPWLREWLKPATPERLGRLLADLDAREFSVRTRAMQELEHFGQDVLPFLSAQLKKSLTLESRRRVEQLVERLQKGPPFSQNRATLRAIEALEHIRTADARRLLESLSRSAAEEQHREEARAALARLRKTAKSRDISP